MKTRADDCSQFIVDEPPVSPTTSQPLASDNRLPTFAMSDSNPREHQLSDFGNYRRDLSAVDNSTPSVPAPRGKPIPSHSQPTAQIAPWMTPPSESAPTMISNTFYDDIADSMSLNSQASPVMPAGPFRAQHNPSASFDSAMADSAYYDYDRRPSAASVNTASSQGSKASAQRGGMRKLQGFFGEEFPGRESPDGHSLSTSLSAGIGQSGNHLGSHSHSFSIGTSKDQRSRSYSHTRLPPRDRNFSNATDKDASPSSSRPRTPLPAPEVVPFLYQDNSVCNRPHLTFRMFYPLPFSYG